MKERDSEKEGCRKEREEGKEGGNSDIPRWASYVKSGLHVEWLDLKEKEGTQDGKERRKGGRE